MNLIIAYSHRLLMVRSSSYPRCGKYVHVLNSTHLQITIIILQNHIHRVSECPFPAATANIWDTYRTGNHMIIGPCETVTADTPPPWYLIIIQILNTLAASAQVPFILPNDVISLNPRLLSTPSVLELEFQPQLPLASCLS